MSKLAALLFVLLTAQKDVIQVNTRLVQVNVVVYDKSGTVTNLTKNDFTVLDNKKAQKIDLFTVLDMRVGGKNTGNPLPPGVVSNRLDQGGEVPLTPTIVLYDMLNTEQQFQRDAIKGLVNYLRNIRQEDRIALYILSYDLLVVQDFTGDSEKLVRAASRIKALDLAGTEVRTAQELADRLSAEAGAADTKIAA